MRTVRHFVSIVAAVGMVAAGLGVGATPAEAGDPNSILVIKVVQGPVPPGTQFTVDVECTDNSFDTQLVFGPSGGSQPAILSFGPITCTVTEPQTGGASATTFGCQVTDPGSPPATCQGTNTAVFPGNDRAVTITVTNVFIPPPAPGPEAGPAAAEAVEAAPTFTG